MFCQSQTVCWDIKIFGTNNMNSSGLHLIIFTDIVKHAIKPNDFSKTKGPNLWIAQLRL